MRSVPLIFCSLLAATPACAWRSDHPPGGGYGMHSFGMPGYSMPGYGVPPLVFGVVPPVVMVPAPPMVQMPPPIQSGARYLCDNPRGQYPQVRSCHHPWRTAPGSAGVRQAR